MLEVNSIVLWTLFPFVSTFIDRCTVFQEAASFTTVYKLCCSIYDYLTIYLREKEWISEDALNFRSYIMCLNKSLIETFHGKADNYL